VTYRLVDAAYPPTTVEEWEAVKAATGIEAVDLYVPGWGAPYAQTPLAALQSALQAGLGVNPILVPNPSTAAELTEDDLAVGVQMALEWLASGGADTGTGGQKGVIHLNVEADWYAANPSTWLQVTQRFHNACSALGQIDVPYGSPDFLKAVAALPTSVSDGCWVGEYPGVAPWPASEQDAPSLAGEWTSPGQKQWQFTDEQKVAGFNFDYSVGSLPCWSVPPAPPAPPPDPPAPPAPVNPTVLQPGTYTAGSVTITVAAAS
jgi:hypothetical protein